MALPTNYRDDPFYRQVLANMQSSGTDVYNPASVEHYADLAKKARGIVDDDSLASTKQQGSEKRNIESILGNIPEGGGWGDAPGATKGTNVSGPMDQTERNIVGLMSALTPSMFGVNPFGVLGFASQLASMMGVEREEDPTLTAPTLADIQAMTDAYGTFEGRRAAAARAQAQTQKEESAVDAARAMGDVSQSPEGRTSFGSSLTDRTATEPSTFGMEGPRDSTGGQSGGQTGGQTDGGFGEGSGFGIRKGGYFKTKKPQTKKITWGEKGTGGEEAVFVPKTMKQAGKQPREDEVIMALTKLLAELKAGEV